MHLWSVAQFQSSALGGCSSEPTHRGWLELGNWPEVHSEYLLQNPYFSEMAKNGRPKLPRYDLNSFPCKKPVNIYGFWFKDINLGTLKASSELKPLLSMYSLSSKRAWIWGVNSMVSICIGLRQQINNLATTTTSFR